MKKIYFKSLYTRLVVTFVSIWWLISFVSFGLIARVFTSINSITVESYPQLGAQLQGLRQVTFVTLIISIIIGTLAILYFSQGIVKPINRLSDASKLIAKGDYSIKVPEEGRDELSLLSKNFNQMSLALYRTDQSRKDFVSSVSHEFKTPVTSIKGFAQMIKQSDDLSKIKQYSDIIIEESDNLNTLSIDLLTLTQIDSDVLPKAYGFIQVDEILRKTILSLEPLWKFKNIEFDLTLEPVTLKVSESSLNLVFKNLITNAIKYSNPDTKIIINLKEVESEVIFIIQDEGLGIESDELDHIFERFYKAEKNRSEDGHGLGLAIVKASLDKMKASVVVESKLHKGSKFTIVFKK